MLLGLLLVDLKSRSGPCNAERLTGMHLPPIASQGAADIFLDTPIYNAYTTGADNLWSELMTQPYSLLLMESRIQQTHLLQERVLMLKHAYEVWLHESILVLLPYQEDCCQHNG